MTYWCAASVEGLRMPMQAIEDAPLKRAKVKSTAELVPLRGRGKGR